MRERSKGYPDFDPAQIAPPMLLCFAPVTDESTLTSLRQRSAPIKAIASASLYCITSLSGTTTSSPNGRSSAVNCSIKKTLKAPPPVISILDGCDWRYGFKALAIVDATCLVQLAKASSGDSRAPSTKGRI